MGTWRLKGNLYECCIAEGQCPFQFGRDMEGGCKSFATFEIKEGEIDNVDMKGINLIYFRNILTSKFAERAKFTEGGIYISDNATEEQRKILEPFVKARLFGPSMKCLAVKFVPIQVSKEGNTYHITMPFGEARITPTTGKDGKAIRIVNVTLPFVQYYDACKTDSYKFNDLGESFSYENRSGIICDFEVQGQ